MEHRLYYQSTDVNNMLLEVSTLSGPINHYQDITGQPGKLTFTVQQDPNNLLQVTSGGAVMYEVDKKQKFKGYVFTSGTDATNTYKITAFDQMRYLKNKDSLIFSKTTASNFFARICEENGLKYKILVPSSHILPDYFHDNKTYYQMLEYAIQWTNVNTGRQYFIRDDAGVLIFSELAYHKTGLIIGDESLLVDYQYEVSIDRDTANVVKAVRADDEKGKLSIWIEKDSYNLQRWGKLQHLEKVDKDMNEAQIRQLVSNLMKLKNKETKTMRLKALGADVSAGSGFRLRIDKLKILEDMWIKSISHDYEKDFHTMDIEVSL